MMIDLNLKVRYRIGDVVFARSDVDSRLRFVTGYIIRRGIIVYIISLEGTESYFYDFELISENEQLMGLN
jgi:hypothetical protein